MTRGWTKATVVAAGASAFACGVVLCGPRSEACPTGDPVNGDGDTVPHEVYLAGFVERVSGRVLRVGSNVIRIPADKRALPSDDGYCYSDLEDVFFDRAVVGDVVEVDGSLLPDGTILAYQLARTDGEPDANAEVVSGIVESVGDGTFTVAGESLTIVPDRAGAGGEPVADWAFVQGGTSFDGVAEYVKDGRLVLVLPGDAVAASVVRTDDGRVLANYVVVRETGEATVVVGTLRAWDAATADLDVDGVTVRVDVEGTWIVKSPPAHVDFEDLDASYFVSAADVPTILGAWARVRGVLRDGVVVADSVVVTDVPDATKRAKRHGPGRLKTRGVVTGVGAGRIDVNNLGVRVGRRPRNAAVAARTPRLALGARLSVSARLVADGPVALAVRRN